MTQWFYRKSGMLQDETVGPLNEDQVATLIRSGKVKPDTGISSPEATGGQWVALSSVDFSKALWRLDERAKIAKSQADSARAAADKERAKAKAEEAARQEEAAEKKREVERAAELARSRREHEADMRIASAPPLPKKARTHVSGAILILLGFGAFVPGLMIREFGDPIAALIGSFLIGFAAFAEAAGIIRWAVQPVISLLEDIYEDSQQRK